MTKALTPDDIRDFLNRFASAIMRDQVHVDALSPDNFHPQYNSDMWLEWRLDHLAYLNTLLLTLDTITPNLLKELTRIAVTKKPATVRRVAIELLAECSSRCCPREDVATARLFFGRLIHELSDRPEAILTDRDAKTSMFLWLAATDPLGISRDPECGYGNAAGLTG
ncbi:hypothetical protein [Afipia sp. GAS231]|uniref:hypothetical protein n=1 Tax=Afipia sp. GAS231 TaxID=1882747 RepID=UPI0008793520|nr:hypothetical protein [Afipia sp. GAS231]SDO55342.1 hypothetical protein SAMN05444050_4428 [Afipia sp. GAS231]